VILGGLLIAFVALIALANGILGGIGGWFGIEDLTFQQLLGWIFAPIAWLIGVPWSEAATVGSLLGQKTVINEFVAFASFGPLIPNTGPEDGVNHHLRARWFANFGSIAIQIGAFGSLAPERRGDVAWPAGSARWKLGQPQQWRHRGNRRQLRSPEQMRTKRKDVCR